MNYQTLEEDNQFSFICPIFNAETKMSACIKLRNKVWRGERPEVRRGCQACMSANKCPAAIITQRMAMSSPNRPVADDYYSATPVKGKLRADVLERIASVLVPHNILSQGSVTGAEVKLIESSSERIFEMLGKAPLAGAAKQPTRSKTGKVSIKAAEKKVEPDAISHAARTGDMSAAISEGASK